MAITSLILGILAIVPCILFLTGIPAVILGHLALSKIKKSGGAFTGKGLAITGLVTGYLSLLMTVLLLPASIQGFKKARETAMATVCKIQLQQIASAKQQWATANHKQNGDTPAASDLTSYLPNGIMPKCPEGGTYQINPIGTSPTCSVPGHTLESLTGQQSGP